MRRSDWPRLATPPALSPPRRPDRGENIGVGGNRAGWGAGCGPRCHRARLGTGLLLAARRGSRCPAVPVQPPHPSSHTKPRGGGPGPFACCVCGSRAGAAPREGRGYRGVARCGAAGALLALPAVLPGTGHVERPSPAPLGRAGTGDPGRERDERDAGPSSLLISASGGDTAPASRHQARGPWTRPGNRECRRRHRAPLRTVCLTVAAGPGRRERSPGSGIE